MTPHNRHAVRGFYGGGNEGVAHHPFQAPLRVALNVRTSRFSERILAGQNALIEEKCDARTPLVDVATCFTGLVDNQRDSAMLRDAIQHLPPVRMAIPATTALKSVMEASEFLIAPWPRRFMEQKMGAAILYCRQGGKEIDVPERAEASTHFRVHHREALRRRLRLPGLRVTRLSHLHVPRDALLRW